MMTCCFVSWFKKKKLHLEALHCVVGKSQTPPWLRISRRVGPYASYKKFVLICLSVRMSCSVPIHWFFRSWFFKKYTFFVRATKNFFLLKDRIFPQYYAYNWSRNCKNLQLYLQISIVEKHRLPYNLFFRMRRCFGICSSKYLGIHWATNRRYYHS